MGKLSSSINEMTLVQFSGGHHHRRQVRQLAKSVPIPTARCRRRVITIILLLPFWNRRKCRLHSVSSFCQFAIEKREISRTRRRHSASYLREYF